MKDMLLLLGKVILIVVVIILAYSGGAMVISSIREISKQQPLEPTEKPILSEISRLQKDIMHLEAEIAKNFIRIQYLEEWRTNVLVQLRMGECAKNKNCFDPLPFGYTKPDNSTE